MVSSTNLRVVILTKINTLLLFILFKIIVDTKCSFVRCSPFIVFFFCSIPEWVVRLREMAQACLIEVARAGWIERPLLIRKGVNP